MKAEKKRRLINGSMVAALVAAVAVFTAMLQIEKNIIADISEFKQRYTEIEKAIREVPDLEQREILEMKYIQGKSVRVIALTKCYSTRQLRRKLREAEMSVKPPKSGRSQQVASKLK